MTLNLPTDGQGVYDYAPPNLASSTWQPRLDLFAAGGFKLVVNYALLFGSIAQITTYINYAASKGMKVMVAVHNPVIWDTVQYPTSSALAAEYPTLYAACGSPTSNWDQTFTQYVVNNLKSLSGVWGWYLADEPVSSQHTALFNHAGYVRSADSTHPRLIMMAGGSSSACANNTSVFYDCCEVTGDDYYPIGDASAYTLTTVQTAAGIQSFCITHALSSCMALQAFSWGAYSRPGEPWPTYAQMQQMRNDALTNMKPRVLLWYDYFDIVNPAFNAPALQWQYVQNAALGRSGIARFPNAVRRGIR